MNILVKYIAQEFIKFFCLFLCGFIALVLLGSLFGRLGEVFSSAENVLLYLQEITLFLSDLIGRLLPVTILLATITTFNLLNRTSEIIAMRTTGMGFFQLAQPIFIVVVCIASLNYFNQNYLYNWLANHFEATKTSESLAPVWKIKEDRIYYFGVRHLDSTLEKIAIFHWKTAPYRVSQRTTIESGAKTDNAWHFKNIHQRQFLSEPLTFQQQTTTHTPFDEFPTVSFKQPLDPQHQPLWGLYQTSVRLQQEGLDSTKHWVQFYQKLAYPFTLLIMVLIGISLSISHARQGKVAESLAFSCLLGIFFWIAHQIFLAIGNVGLLPPYFAAWLNNFIFFGLALVLMRYYRF